MRDIKGLEKWTIDVQSSQVTLQPRAVRSEEPTGKSALVSWLLHCVDFSMAADDSD